MADKPFEFDLYRLIILDQEDVFDFIGQPATEDAHYLKILKLACSSQFDVTHQGPKNHWKWSLRDFHEMETDLVSNTAEAYSLRFARSLTEQSTPIVTDETIIDGRSHADPPAAVPIRIIFHMRRHLVAVEHNSSITSTHAWHDALHEILDRAAATTEFRSRLRLEAVPEANQVLQAFMSFERLTQLRVTLRLPNPEVSPYAESLYQQMREGGVMEYLNDLKSSRGISQAEGKLPHQVASLAQDGYKKGDVLLAGIKNGKRRRVRTGRHAARGQVDKVRDFVRGQASVARSKEAQSALGAVLEEIDRLHPEPKKRMTSNNEAQ